MYFFLWFFFKRHQNAVNKSLKPTLSCFPPSRSGLLSNINFICRKHLPAALKMSRTIHIKPRGESISTSCGHMVRWPYRGTKCVPFKTLCLLHPAPFSDVQEDKATIAIFINKIYICCCLHDNKVSVIIHGGGKGW